MSLSHQSDESHHLTTALSGVQLVAPCVRLAHVLAWRYTFFTDINDMANTPAAKKALRQTKVRTERNRRVKEDIRWQLKQAQKAIVSGASSAEESVKKVIRAIDRAAQKHIYPKNTAARMKSRLRKRLRTAKQPKEKE